MSIIFTNGSHKDKYIKLITKAAVNEFDWERHALFYIISGNEDLYLKKRFIYDFFENSILPDCLESKEVDFCTSSKALIRLAFNLYNSYSDYYTNPLFLLGVLDTNNFVIAYQAILLRFQGRHECLALACHGG